MRKLIIRQLIRFVALMIVRRFVKKFERKPPMYKYVQIRHDGTNKDIVKTWMRCTEPGCPYPSIVVSSAVYSMYDRLAAEAQQLITEHLARDSMQIDETMIFVWDDQLNGHGDALWQWRPARHKDTVTHLEDVGCDNIEEMELGDE